VSLHGSPPDPAFVIGQYLLGLADEAAVLALMQHADAHGRCQAAYYLGLKARNEARYADALGWFRVAVATGASPAGQQTDPTTANAVQQTPSNINVSIRVGSPGVDGVASPLNSTVTEYEPGGTSGIR